MGKTALVFGGTGLVGRELVSKLVSSGTYDRVVVPVRKETRSFPSGAEEIVFQPDQEASWADLVSGNDLFCCLGTTIRKAGSQEAFEKVDLHLPVRLATLAAEHGMEKFLVISSIGASARSSNFYLRTKGKMEEQVRAVPGLTTVTLRPSMLLGNRQEFRFGEAAGKVIMSLLNPLMLGRWRKYRGIRASRVASAMIHLACMPDPPQIVESDQLEKLGQIHDLS